MKRLASPLLVAAALLLASCATWPVRDDDQLDPVQLHPSLLESPEMAASFLKNMKGKLGATDQSQTVEVDRYSVRFTWRWASSETQTKVNAYLGVAKTTTTSTPHEETVAIPLPKVQGFSVHYWPTRAFLRVKPEAYFRKGVNYWTMGELWFFNVHLAGQPAVFIRVPDEQTAQQLADTLGTLARAAGGKVEGEDVLMANVRELTPPQREELGQPAAAGGLLLLEVIKGGAASRAGLRFLDVVTRVNGQSTPNLPSLRKALDGAPTAAQVTFLRREGDEAEGRRVLERTVTLDR